MDAAKIISETNDLLNFFLKSYKSYIYQYFRRVTDIILFRDKKELKLLPINLKLENNIKHEESSNKTDLAGIPHLIAINKCLDKQIEIYDEKENLRYTIGENRKTKPIKLQYHEDRLHYTLLNDKEPFACALGGMCLYNCISDQTNIKPERLKQITLDTLNKCKLCSAYIDTDPCWGGATYTGRGPHDACWYLDNCQGKRGYKFPAKAHPRNHASNPGGIGVEQYSHQGRKTGFENYEEQDFVAHYALNNSRTRQSMDSLNRGSYREVVNISGRDLDLPRSLTGGEWIDGERTDTFTVNTVTLVIQHYEGEFDNPQAPVFIQTMYPRYP